MLTTVFYYDITKDGKDLEGYKDISKLTNNQAILESVKSILSTEPGQNIMDPQFGTGLESFLFEPIDLLTSAALQNAIRHSITKFEPRVHDLSINILPDEDTNTYNIDIIFTTKYSITPVSLSLSLNKIR